VRERAHASDLRFDVSGVTVDAAGRLMSLEPLGCSERGAVPTVREIVGNLG
jgi:hypothetical protein